MEELTIWEQHTITLNKVSGCLLHKQFRCDRLEIICVSDAKVLRQGYGEDVVVFSYSTCDNFTWNSRETEVQTTYLWCVIGFWSVLSGCTNTEVKVEPGCMAQRQFQYCFRGYCKRACRGWVEDRASDLSVSQHRLQQEFIATHPAAPHSTSWLFTIPPQTECRWNVVLLPLSLHWISHTCSHSAHLLSCILSLLSCYSFVYLLLFTLCLKASFSHNGRIPNWGLALPYQEARTSLTQTAGIQLWWCRMCCQTDQPWGDCCKLTSIDLMWL